VKLPAALGLSVVFLVAMDSLLFHTSLYPSIAEPGESTGIVHLFLQNELKLQTEPNWDPAQHVLAIGDSRMGGFMPRVANDAKLGYTYSSISVPAATPRCWYYMLREVDPQANRYAAIIVPMEDYNDSDQVEPYADRMLDINMLASVLRWSDLPEFALSYDMHDRRHEAALEIALRGIVYREDLQQFLDSAKWFYFFKGPAKNMTDVHVDFAAKTVTLPPDATSNEKERYERHFIQPLPEEQGKWSRYIGKWVGKVVEHYRGSKTKLVFIRIPRGPYIRPDLPGPNPKAWVRKWAQEPQVRVTPEDFFNTLEQPELFIDELHLNGPGSERFSAMLAKLVSDDLAR
jgi:hypothetical protein